MSINTNTTALPPFLCSLPNQPIRMRLGRWRRRMSFFDSKRLTPVAPKLQFPEPMLALRTDSMEIVVAVDRRHPLRRTAVATDAHVDAMGCALVRVRRRYYDVLFHAKGFDRCVDLRVLVCAGDRVFVVTCCCYDSYQSGQEQGEIKLHVVCCRVWSARVLSSVKRCT